MRSSDTGEEYCCSVCFFTPISFEKISSSHVYRLGIYTQTHTCVGCSWHLMQMNQRYPHYTSSFEECLCSIHLQTKYARLTFQNTTFDLSGSKPWVLKQILPRVVQIFAWVLMILPTKSLDNSSAFRHIIKLLLSSDSQIYVCCIPFMGCLPSRDDPRMHL